MNRTLTTSATGLQAQQANIERISNDLANVNTDAYKRSRNEFEELMYETLKEPGARLGEATSAPVGIQRGNGVKVGSIHKDFEQGPARMTYNQYDMMINGKGFFPTQAPTGEVVYTRAGNFHRDAQGRIVTGSGHLLLPPITVPSNANSITINPQGEVRAIIENTDQVIGQIQIVGFVNEQGLNAIGSSFYLPTNASGPPTQGVPGENGLGNIQQGAVEGSNVNVANSIVDMISAQRAYEMNTKVMTAADKMWEHTINLK